VSEASPAGAVPPELPGYRFLTHIGSGGNAQVYLYEQELPSRKVAVKVLNDSALSEAARRRFVAEANVTAVLAHRHIVQVFDAKVTDDGQPYIVMPFYPQPNLSVRARRAHFSVAQVLRIGIQIGSAVETSHRHGVLHRDIKPQNILTDSYGDPALTDFGIATTKAGDGPEGLSVPWSPPEILDGTGPGDQRSDVYSLGATLWHLLVGRPPFEQPGDGNTTGQLMDRIHSDPPPRTQRADVPDSLERLLRQTLAKDQAARPQSAMELIRGLQSIEQELRLPVTHPILPADEPVRGDTHGDTVARPAANAAGPAARRLLDPVRPGPSPAAGAQPTRPAEDTGGSGAAEGSGGSGAAETDPGTRPDEPTRRQPDRGGGAADATIARAGRPDAPWSPRSAGTPPEGATRSRPDAARPDAARPDTARPAVHDGPAARTAEAGEGTVTRGREPVRLDPWGGAGPQAPGAQGLNAQGPGASSPGAQVPGTRPRQFPAGRPDAATVARSGAGRFARAESAGPNGPGPGPGDLAPGDHDPGDHDPGDRGPGDRGLGDRGAVDSDVAGKQGRAGSRRVLAFAGGGVLLAVAATVAVLALAHGATPGSAQTGAGQTAQQTGLPDALGPGATLPGPPTVTTRGIGAKRVEFSWTYANPASGDTFRWQVANGGTGEPVHVLTRPDLVLTVAQGQSVCITVTVRRADSDESGQSAPACWPH